MAGRRLAPYRAKRDFTKTPEPPAPGAPPRLNPAAPLFLVHKHDATRLHYDLRLQIAGALASWAVPRGPSVDPRVKRLAVQTEDHPLAYAEFEGRIPDAEYGGGDALIWDRGTFETDPPGQQRAQLEKGHLRIRLRGQKLRGLWHLVRTARGAADKPQWLFFKAQDAEARPGYDLVAARPESVQSGRRLTRGPVGARTLASRHPPPLELLARLWPPQLATLAHAVPDEGGAYRYEVKYDGFRALGAISGGRVALQSRAALDLAARFPALAQALARVRVGEAVLDGEIVALDARGRSRFELLQQGRGTLCLMAFDLLLLEGEDLRPRPLEDRRDLLESLLANAGPLLRVSELLPGPAEAAIAEAQRRGLEGVMAKRLGSPYRGEHTRSWLKLKLKATQDAAVVGFVPIRTGAQAVGALLLGVREGRGLAYAGKVGTGFTEALRRALYRQLEALRIPGPGASGVPRSLRCARWVEPKLVAEVAFSEWTRDGKLRQPVFRGLRADKTAGECRREPAQAAATPSAARSRARRRKAR